MILRLARDATEQHSQRGGQPGHRASRRRELEGVVLKPDRHCLGAAGVEFDTCRPERRRVDQVRSSSRLSRSGQGSACPDRSRWQV
jgi:hypothetical protein